MKSRNWRITCTTCSRINVDMQCSGIGVFAVLKEQTDVGKLGFPVRVILASP